MKNLTLCMLAMALVSVLGFSSCKDSTADDLSGTSSYKAIVALLDTLSGNYLAKPLASQPVFLRASGAASGYLYSVTSDNLANFNFTPIDPSKNFLIYANLSGTVMNYYGELNYPVARSTGKDTLLLKPDEHTQNGLFYNLYDSNHGRFSGVNCYIYTVKNSWDTRDTVNYAYLVKSDAAGRCLKMNLAPGIYYIYARAKTGGSVVTGVDTMKIAFAGIRKKKITVQ